MPAARSFIYAVAGPETGTVAAPLVGLWLLDALHLAAGALAGIGAVVAAVGVLGYAWTVVAFAREQGTPAPTDAPGQLVDAGLYTYSRNPMYACTVLTLLGCAALFRSGPLLLYAAVIAGVYHGIVVRVEEPRLEQRFGEAYREYRRAVPRWVLVVTSPSG